MPKGLAPIIGVIFIFLLTLSVGLNAQIESIPKSHHNIFLDQDGNMFCITADGDTLPHVEEPAEYTLEMMRIMPEGDNVGVHFDFDNPDFTGKIYYGFYPDLNEVEHAYPVYYGRFAKIESGVAVIDFVNSMSGKYDFIETEGYWPLNHMVSTSDKALSCTECHSKDGRLKKPNDFYLPGRNYSSLIDTGGVIFMILVLLGVIVHGLMRIVSSKKTQH